MREIRHAADEGAWRMNNKVIRRAEIDLPRKTDGGAACPGIKGHGKTGARRFVDIYTV
jgi:hypothetical protein